VVWTVQKRFLSRAHLLNLLPLHTILHLRGITGNKESCGRRANSFLFILHDSRLFLVKRVQIYMARRLPHSVTRPHHIFNTHSSSALEPGDKTRFKLNPFPSRHYFLWSGVTAWAVYLALSMPVSTLPRDLSPALFENRSNWQYRGNNGSAVPFGDYVNNAICSFRQAMARAINWRRLYALYWSLTRSGSARLLSQSPISYLTKFIFFSLRL
jgi:hypothetical protein